MSGPWLALALGAAGLALSALFSGSETGLYRVSRVRLVLDALAGDTVARLLLWLVNRPSLFVATVLVGNNLANCAVSLGIVLGAQRIFAGGGHAVELLAPLALTPVLFVYGELLPKDLFLRAPNRLLRRGAPAFLAFTAAFLPVSLLLWGVNLLAARLIGRSPQQVRLALARRELQRVLEEGHEVGILRPSQRDLADGVFAVAGRPVREFAQPLRDAARARSDMSKDEVLRLARRLQIAAVPVEDAAAPGKLLGYVQVIELALAPGEGIAPMRPLLQFRGSDAHLLALMRMQSAKEGLAAVVDERGEVVGLVTAARLRAPLFRRKP